MFAAGAVIDDVPALARRHRLALVSFLGLLAILLFAMAGTVQRLIALWAIEDGYYSYGFLILPVSLLLIWRLRRDVMALPPKQEPLALPALIASGSLWLVARAADVTVVEYLAMLVSACLLVLAVFGRDIVRRLAFPLAFLFFMLPFGAPLLPPLQAITTSFADGMLQLVGIPTYREGTLIETSFGLFNIAEECAGLQFLAANLVAGVLFAYLAFSSLPRQVLVILVSIIAPILVNGIRAFGIITAVHLSGDASIAGPDHIVYGWVLFMVAIVITFVVGAKFADWPDRSGPGAIFEAPTTPWRPAFLLPLMLCLVLAPAYAALVLDRPAAGDLLPARLALELPPSCETLPFDDDGWRLDAGGGRTELATAFRCHDRTVDVALVHGGRYRDSDDLVYRTRQWDTGNDWRIVSTGKTAMTGDHLPDHVHHHDLVAPGDRKRRVYFWYWLDGDFIASERTLLLKGLVGRLLGESLPFALVAISPRSREPGVEGDFSRWLSEVELAGDMADSLAAGRD